MLVIPPISTENSRPRHRQTRMLMVLCCLRQCSSNLPVGHTIAQLLGLEMLVEALRIRPSKTSERGEMSWTIGKLSIDYRTL